MRLWPAIAAAADTPSTAAIEWVQLTPTVSPSPREGVAMAYDLVSGKIVIFGGYSGTQGYLGDTWTFDGVTWTQLTPPVSPPARVAASMAYDAAIQKLVMFGGYTTTAGYFGDTWVFDGSTGTWEHPHPSLSPPAATEPSVFTDPVTGRVDTFGGFNTQTQYQSSIWQFAGTTWIQLTPAASPSARCGAIATLDSALKNVVLFGGQGVSDTVNTWTWDGANWTEQSPAHQPPSLDSGAAAFGPGFAAVIAFGGEGANQTWAWTGSNWGQVQPTSSPSARSYDGMAYDPALGHIILFGGFNGAYFNDTWELIPTPSQ